MKKTPLRQAAMKLALVACVLLAPLGLRAQETLTVYDGTATNNYVPMYGGYFDDFTKSEFVIPANALEDMAGGTISAIKFYISSVATYGTGWDNTHQVVFLKEVGETTLSAYSGMDDATIVFDGMFTVPASTDTEFEITFTTPYQYEGENLLIGIYNTVDGSYRTVNWYGQSVTGASGGSSNGSALSSVSFSQRNFIPKTTFTYEPAQQGGDVCEKPTTCNVSNLAATSATLTWTGGSGTYNVELKAGSDDWATVLSGTTLTTTTLTLEPATSYQARVQSVCAGSTPTSGWKTSSSFLTPCLAVTTFPWSENFDSHNTGAFSAPCWVNEHISGNGTNVFSISTSNNQAGSTKTLNLPDMSNGTMTKLRLPEMTLPAGDNYIFTIDVYRNASGSSYTSEGVRVYASTDGEIEGATELGFLYRNYTQTDGGVVGVESASGWYTYELPIPFTGTCYIILRGESSYGSATYMDNFKVSKVLPCVKPSSPTFVSSTTTAATLDWTNGAEGQTAWQIAYSTDPNFDPASVTPVDVTVKPGTITGLTASTVYYAYVRANCGEQGYSEWSAAKCQFATECAEIPAVGYSENFDGYTTGNNVLPLCWNYINTTTYSYYKSYPKVYNSYANSPSNCIYFYSSYSSYSDYDPQPQYAILPEMSELAGKFVTLWAKGYYATSTFKIGTMTDPADANSFVAFTEQTLTTSYQEFEYVIPTNAAGHYLAIMIDAASSDRTTNGVYIDDIQITEVPTCFKPSALMLETPSARTAHTATLKWTNGEPGQSAWQIAYSTVANFDPDTVTPVDVTENPATISGLVQSTTYYAYVRANCGNGDYSAWNNAKATFTTLAGNVTPSGLAVDNATITSEQATVNWNAVAGNELHEYYQLYYSRLSTMDQNNLNNDSLITSINTTSYTFTHLDATTTYYVWVRDYCGDDGYSAWSSRINFTTASACQTPDGLAASNVTTNSATISWNTYGRNEFNLRYSTDGADWTTVENVNSPHTLNGVLHSNTAYQVQVQATCNTEAWSATLNFNTKCDARNDFPISYGFETSEGFQTGITYSSAAPTTNDLGNCWRNQATSNTGSSYTRLWCTSTSYYKNGSQSLMLPDKNNFNTTLLAFPGMNFSSANGYKLSFWIKREATNSNPEGFKVYVSHTDTIDASAVELGHYSRNYNIAYPQIESTSNWYKYEVYIPQATITGIVYLIFEGQSYYGNSTYVDDVTIEEAPSCYPVGTLADATNIEARSARLSWTLVDNNQDYWDVQYATNDAFSAGVHTNENVAVHTNYTLGNLDPETHYYVRVRANCGGGDYSEWSNTIDFETDPTCFPVGTLTYDNVGTHSAELSWVLVDDNQDNWDVQYATNDAFSEGVQTVADVNDNTDYTLSGLTPETHYWVRVRANCGNEDGYGAWSNAVDFTTGIACPAPTALTLDASTTETLTISWTGSADTWIIAYKEAESLGDFTIATEDATNPYTITGLTDGTLYTVRVRANCGNVNGLSQWLAEDFQTEASCPSPYDLAVTDASETAHGATITWSGNSDNDSYTVEYAEGPLTAPTTLLNEDFESGNMPTGWATDGPGTWSVGSGDYSAGTGAGHGTYNAKITHGTTDAATKLITPEIDLSGVTSPTLSYMHIQRSWSGDQDELRVYYRTSSSESWTLLAGQEYTAEVATWTSENDIALPNPSSTYQIAFEMTDGYGYGVGVDNVVVTAEYTPSHSWNTLEEDVTSPYVINNLDPETQYVVRVKGVCGSTPSPASNIVGFTTGIACYAPENFAVDLSTVTHNSVELSWTATGGTTTWVVAYKADGDANFTEVENVTENAPYRLEGLDPETHYTVKVRSDCGGEGYSSWSEEKTFTTIEACAAPTAFVLGNVAAHQATFSWTAGNGNTAWKVYVKEHGAAEYPAAYTDANTASATISGLEAATAYDVKIVPTCDENKILEVANAFTTLCEAVTIPAEGWTEDFNSYSGNSTSSTVPSGYPDHTMPSCWQFLNMSDNSSNYPQAFLTTNSGYPVSGNCLFFKSSTSTPLYAILPEFTNKTSDLAITFTYRNESTNESNGTIIVGYMTDPTDASTFEPVLTCDRTNTKTTKNATFTGAPDGSYIAFKYQGGTYNNYYAAIDDVTVQIVTTIEKSIDANKWYAIASPVHNDGSNQTLAGVTNLTTGTYDLYGYTESAGTWNKPTTTLNLGKGYIYRRSTPATITFVGLPNSGDHLFTVTNQCPDADIDGFNLIGNPFPHAISYSNYYTLQPNGLWLAHDAGTIGVAEAFLIHTEATGSEQIEIDDVTPSKNAPAAVSTLAFTVSNGEFEDVAYAKFDGDEDLPKIGHLEPNAPALSIPVDGRKYAIANLGSDCESFEMTFNGIGDYTISASGEATYLHLIDKVTGSDIDLLSQPTYSFRASLGDLSSRFLVKLAPNGENANNGTFAFWNGNSWTIEGEGTLEAYDVMGRRIFAREANADLRLPTSAFPSAGVYILRLGGNSQKVVIK